MDYRLIRSRRKTVENQVDKNGEVLVRAPWFALKNKIDKIVSEKEPWIAKTRKKVFNREKPILLSQEEAMKLRKYAYEYFPKRLPELSERFGFSYNKIRITSARTRYGSCSSKNNISLSYFLAFYSQEAIDYVMVHELCHTKEHNHSKRFYSLLESCLPDWKERKKLLERPMPEVSSQR